MKKYLLLLLAIIIPEVTFALEKDFYTYNSITETADAFNRIALIFGDATYNGLFAGLAVAGFMLGGLVLYVRGLMGQKVNPLGYVVPLLIGVMVYQAFILPKGKVHVYDQTRNAYQVVNNVPDGIIFLAWGLNTIERAIISVVDTNTANIFAKYETQAGGVAFKLISNATSQYKDANDSYLTKSLVKYYEDCGSIALANESVSANELRRGTEDIQATLAKMKSDSVKTIYYSEADKTGSIKTCTDAWTSINTALNTASTLEDVQKNMCKTGGYNPSVAPEFNACKTLMSNATQLYGIVGGTDTQFVKNMYLADVMLQAALDGNTDVAQKQLANRNIMLQSAGISNTLNEWMPRIRGFMFTVILGMIPIVMLFAVTPLFTRSLFLLLSLLVWYTTWSVMDVVLHESAHDVAMRSFEQLSNFKMGLDAIWLSPESSVSSMGVFGQARTIAFVLAGIITSGLFKMTAGSGMASAANQGLNRMTDTAAQTAHTMGTPEGVGQHINQVSSGLASTAVYGNHGMNSMVASSAWGDSVNINRSNYEASSRGPGQNMFDHSQTFGAAQSGANVGKANALKTWGNMNGVTSNEGLARMQQGLDTIGSSRDIMGTESYKSSLKRHGFDVSTPEKFMESAAFSEHYNNYDRISQANSTAQKVDMLQGMLYDKGLDFDKNTISDLYTKFEHGQSMQAIKAHDASGDSFIGTGAISMRKHAKETIGEHDAIKAQGQDPDHIHSQSGKMQGFSAIGNEAALQAMSEQSYIDAAKTHKMWDMATSETRQSIANDYFDGDLATAGRAMTSTQPNEELARYLQMSHVAESLYDNNMSQAIISASNTDQRVVVDSDRLMASIEENPNLFDFNRDQLNTIKNSDAVELHWGFNANTGTTANVSAYTGSRAEHSQSSSVDLHNERKSGDIFNADTLSDMLRNPTASNQEMFQDLLGKAYTEEHTQTQLINAMEELYSRQVTATSTDTTTLSGNFSVGAEGGLSTGRDKIPLNAGVNGSLGGVISQDYQDASHYNINYRNAETTFEQLDAKVRGYANESGDTNQEKKDIYAKTMVQQLSAFDDSYSNMISREAKDESDGNETRRLNEKAIDKPTNSGKIQRD